MASNMLKVGNFQQVLANLYKIVAKVGESCQTSQLSCVSLASDICL